DSDAAVYDALLNKTPAPITSSNPELPIEFERIIDHALEKDREARYQTAMELRVELKRLAQGTDSGRFTSGAAMALGVRRSIWSGWQMKTLSAALIAVLTIAAWFLVSRVKSREPTSSSKSATFTQLTDQAGPEFFPSLSPDGNSFIYAGRAAGKWDIYLQ